MPILSPPRHPNSPLATMRGDHAGLRVPDLEQALAWYRDTLDFRLVASTEGAGLTWAFIAPPDDDSFLIELAAGPGAADRPAAHELKDTLGLHGWHHLSLRVGNVDDTVAELRRRGVNVIAGPMDFPEIKRRGAFFLDPWGNLFEIIQPLST